MGENYTGPAKHVTTLRGVLEATTSLQVRKWKTPELDHLYNVASGMLAGATGGELLQLQNSIREIVARKSDKQGLKWKLIAAVSALAALVTLGLKFSDSTNIRILEDRTEVLESRAHSHQDTPTTPPRTDTPTSIPANPLSPSPTKNQ